MSPAPLKPFRLTAKAWSSVPAVSPATSVSLPARASISTRSTPPRSVTTFAMLRRRRTRGPLAETSIVSAAALPLKSRTSAPTSPSTTSLSSPGFQVKRSLPVPSRTVSSPSPPETESLPLPPIRVWSPRLPARVSWPLPPSTVVTSSKNWPRLVKRSSPPRAWTSIAVNVPRSKLRSPAPSPSMSTSRTFGLPGWSWSVMSSAPFVPLMNSVPFCTWAVVAAVAWATVKPSAAVASTPAASARDLPVAYMGGPFVGRSGDAARPPSRAQREGFHPPTRGIASPRVRAGKDSRCALAGPAGHSIA